ncbi:MAG: hypothetical protein HQK53_07805 [Oligoflexia bacterium]|nr:hypothetical protein [Oligoflexia bacterium]
MVTKHFPIIKKSVYMLYSHYTGATLLTSFLTSLTLVSCISVNHVHDSYKMRLPAAAAAENRPEILPPPYGDHNRDIDQKIYDRLFPYYAKFCAISRYQYKAGMSIGTIGNAGGSGSPFGHYITYLKGVCKDNVAPYPRLKMCPAESDFTNPDLGVALSANVPFKNVCYVAVPTQKWSFDGNIQSEEESIDPKKVEEIISDFVDTGFFDGVTFHSKYLPRKHEHLSKRDLLKFMIRNHAIFSDFAVHISRASYCVKIPISKSLMEQSVMFLNEINDYHASYKNLDLDIKQRGKKYNWCALKNNCVRFGLRLASFMGILDENKAGAILMPANQVVDLMARTNLESVDIESVFRDNLLRETFLKYNYIPMQAGAISEVVGPFTKNNQIFNYQDYIYTLKRNVFVKAFISPKSRRNLFHSFFFEQEYRDFILQNRQMFNKYRSALKQMIEMESNGLLRTHSAQFQFFFQRYKQYLQQELKTMDELQSRFLKEKDALEHALLNLASAPT